MSRNTDVASIWGKRTLFDELDKRFKKHHWNLCELKTELDDLTFKGCSSGDDKLSAGDKALILCDAYDHRRTENINVFGISSMVIAGFAVLAALEKVFPDVYAWMAILIGLVMVFVLLLVVYLRSFSTARRQYVLREALGILAYRASADLTANASTNAAPDTASATDATNVPSEDAASSK